MTTQRMWPLLLGLGVLLSAALASEVVARNSEGEVIAREITADENAWSDEGEQDSGQWYAAEPRNESHESARTYARRGDYAEALKAFEVTLSSFPEDPALWAEYGHWLRRADRKAEASAALERSLSLDPKRGDVYLDLALLAVANDDDAAARVAFERSLELRPEHNGVRIAYGNFLRRHEDLERARDVLEPATSSGSNDSRARAWVAIGQVHAASGRGELALAAFESAVERAPAVASLWARAARALVELESNSTFGLQTWQLEALGYARRATSLAPNNSYVHDVLGVVCERNNLEDEAYDAYRRAAQLDSGARHARSRVIRLAIVREDWTAARQAANGLLELDEQRAEYHFYLGMVEAAAGDSDAARAAYARAIEVSEEPYAEAWFNLGLLERREGQYEAALSNYDRALAIRPNYLAAMNNRGIVLRKLGRLEQARASFEAAIEHKADYASAWVNLARVHADMGAYAESVAAYRKALDVGETSRSVRLELGVNLRKGGQSDAAVRVYRDLVAEQPRYVKAWYNLGIALNSIGEVEEARAAYETALEHDPSHWRSLKNLGLLEYRNGPRDSALAHLAEVLDARPDDVETRVALADLRASEGVEGRAACLYHAGVALRQEPDNAEALALEERCR